MPFAKLPNMSSSSTSDKMVELTSLPLEAKHVYMASFEQQNESRNDVRSHLGRSFE